MRNYALTLAQPTLSEAIIPQALQCLKTARLQRKIRKALLGTGKCPSRFLGNYCTFYSV